MKLIKKFRTENNYYLYNACTNHIVEAGKLIYDLIDWYDKAPHAELVRRFSSMYDPSLLEKALDKIKKLATKGNVLHNEMPAECRCFAGENEIRKNISNSLQQVTLGVTEDCNLRCNYCIYTGSYKGSKVHSGLTMSFETAQASIDYLAEHCEDSTPPVAIGFYGGEPLLNFELIKQVVSYSKKRVKKPLLFTMTTNGTLLNDEISRFLRGNCFSLLVSIDGPEYVHDKHRRFRDSGKGSFDVITRNIRRLRELDDGYCRSMVNLSMTLVPPVDLPSVERFVQETGILPRVSLVQTFGTNLLEQNIIENSLNTGDSGKIMDKLARAAIDGTLEQSPVPDDYLFCRGLYWGGLKKLSLRGYSDGFENGVFKYFNLCIPGASKLFVSSDGTFYVCERVDGMADLRLGSIGTGVDVNKAVRLVQRFNDFRNETCKDCWVIRFCSMCFSTAYHFDGWNREKISHYCDMHRREYTNSLQLYCSIMEKNPLGLDFILEEEKAYEDPEAC